MVGWEPWLAGRAKNSADGWSRVRGSRVRGVRVLLLPNREPRTPEPRSQRQVFAGVLDGSVDQVVLELERLGRSETGCGRQRLLARPGDLEDSGQVAPRQRAVPVVERGPVLLREDRDLQRLAGDHL